MCPGELFCEPSAILVLRRIEALGLPHNLAELGEPPYLLGP